MIYNKLMNELNEQEIQNLLKKVWAGELQLFEAFKIGNDPSSPMDYVILIGALIEFIRRTKKIGETTEKNIPNKKEATI